VIRRAAAVVTAGLWAAVLAGPAVAQEADDARLEALETRLEALSRQAEAIASQARRLQELEDSLRAVTGAMQENRHLLDQIREQLAQLEEARAELNAAPQQQAPVQTAGAGEEPGTADTVPAEGQPAPAAEGPPVPVTQFDDEEASYRRAYELLGLADYAGAEVAFREFIRNYPNSTLTDNAYYWLGESHYVREQYEQAAAEFARGFRSAPDKQKAPDILLKLGLSLIALGKNDDACQAFQRLELDFPDASKRTRDRAALGRERAGCN
jgi:tol-pal system protein YbgF